jgi:trehalose 6-phosphate phosphatase
MPSTLPTDDPDGLAVFLDLDGTLVDIEDRPELVKVPDRLRHILKVVHDQLDGAMALISGRTISSIDALIGPLMLPIAGIHGLEIRDGAGHWQPADAVPVPDLARRRIAELATYDDALLVEDKGSGLAVHFRQCPDKAELIEEWLNDLINELGPEYVLQHGKMVMELRPAGCSKGTAIRTFMSAAPFAGRRPVFIGDDITDEDGFIVVNQMDGFSAKVGPTAGQTAAHYELRDINAVHDWLESVVA